MRRALSYLNAGLHASKYVEFFLSFLFFYIALLPQNARSSCCKKRGKQAVFLPAGSKKYRFANFFQLALLDSPHKKPETTLQVCLLWGEQGRLP